MTTYSEMCVVLQLSSLVDRRDVLCRQFFKSISNKDSCLNYLLPQPRDSDIVNKLRNTVKYLPAASKTMRYQKSFLQFALANYQ